MNPTTVTVTVNEGTQVNHDGTTHKAGETIELDHRDAEVYERAGYVTTAQSKRTTRTKQA